ncbi:NAD-dependent epimerase/dehydratase family protein [Pseudonocardia sp. H11422]|uniref:NAD-dependent epimerase/dehydratase family protein n=1 Tax=Pseudonocardia sp. H11422 TaxID=2835866 RepID=UPI001BDCB325|nr:NAD(P)-dependent oxidoreductase [Pseudonocardia sp. H11422]
MVTVVTGSAGFVGRMLVSALAQDGPVGIDRHPQPPLPGLTRITADLLDHTPEVREALAGAPVVHHLAGSPDVRDARPDAAQWRYRDNVLATGAVLAAVPLETPLLVASSSSVYGGSRGGRPSGEDDRLRLRGGYARSKAVVEQLCAARAQAGGRVAVIRPFTLAGEGQRPGMALSRWIAAAQAGEPLRVFGSMRRSRDITDVEQAVRALVELGNLAGQGCEIGTVNLGTGTPLRLGEIVAGIGRVLGADVRTVVEPAELVEVPHTLADTTRLRALLGWAPLTDIDALITRQLAYPAGAGPDATTAGEPPGPPEPVLQAG